ncbi:MAG: creatininase family protein [Thermoanaerobacterales bacterium]|jgi:creatinine amidohydrolase|nr:creatininase family protein [Thermoanaerobacterales bacterium]
MLLDWYKMASYEIGEHVSSCVTAFAVGSCEQHSEHLPVGTDGFLGDAILRKAAERAKNKVLALPVICYGYSPHHSDFKGYVTLAQDTIKSLILDVCNSIYSNGFDKILILNCHGGNQPALQIAINELGETHEMSPVLVRYWDLIADEIPKVRDTGIGGMGHAGEFETSLMKYYFPALVFRDKISEHSPANGSKWHNPDMFAKNSIYIYKPFKRYSEYGNIGQPQFATNEKGEIISRIIVKRLAELFDYYSANNL